MIASLPGVTDIRPNAGLTTVALSGQNRFGVEWSKYPSRSSPESFRSRHNDSTVVVVIRGDPPTPKAADGYTRQHIQNVINYLRAKYGITY